MIYQDRFQQGSTPPDYAELFKNPQFSKAFGEVREQNIGPVVAFIAGQVPLRDAQFLDIGAGYGSLTVPLLERGASGVAVDISDYSLGAIRYRCAQRGLEGLETRRLDVFNAAALPFESSRFDLVVLNGVIEYAGLSEDPDVNRVQLNLLTEISRVLKENGTLYLATENRFALNYLYGRGHDGLYYSSLMPRALADRYSRLATGRRYTMAELSHRRLLKLTASAGFARVDIYGGMRSYNNPKEIVRLDDAGALAEKVDRHIERAASRLLRKTVIRAGAHRALWPHFIAICRKGGAEAGTRP